MKWIAVLTGDIVRSTILKNDRRKDLYETFPTLSMLLRNQYPQEVTYNISNFRGDGWQLIVNQPQKALEISLFFRTYIRFMFRQEKLDTRIAIGIGPVNFIPPENVSAGDGTAYTLSGHLLESLSSNRMGIDINLEQKELNPIFPGVQNALNLLDHIVTGWSPSQCQAVFWALQHYRQEEIGQKWLPEAISQSSVSNNLKSAGWANLALNLLYLEKAIEFLLNHEIKGEA